VCDPAMGSGAFLVETCRLLGERLVKAWEDHKATPRVPDDEDALTLARRLVAERCLYGVDKNVFAVDLAKLSLWLATLAREHPFTFLDHALRHGDSLVGLSREQIACLHWNPGKQLPLVRTFIDPRVAEAQRLREQIQGMGASDDIPEKARLLRDAEEAIAEVRLIGDVVVSAFFEREKPRDRETLRVAYAGKLESWLPTVRGAGSSDPASVAEQDFSPASSPDLYLSLRSIRSSLREGVRPIPAFHWEIEFPEVFTRDNPGFDAFVGNPPFMSGTVVSTSLGMPHFQWLTTAYAPAGHLCDLVAYFFRRAFSLLRDRGAFGLVATNTIAQGDTRSGGLRVILSSGGTIFSATRRLKWPGAAAVVVSVVHVLKGDWTGRDVELDGGKAGRVSAYLFATGPDHDPERLGGQSELFSAGSKIYGQGFLFDDSDAEASSFEQGRALARDPMYAPRVRPYIGGEELNQNPAQDFSRYVIYLSDVATEQELSQWPELEQIVRTKVKPSRDRLGTNPNNVPLKRRWWAYQAHRPRFYDSIRGLPRVLANCQVGPHLAFAFQPIDRVFAHTLNVFAIAFDSGFACLQGRVHEVWARFFGSSMKDDLRYTPSDCFETFPFPSAWESNPALSEAGREYYEFRAALMVRNNEGLTKTYNRFHDPEERDPHILKLRELHDGMDRAVLDAYGWTDVRPTCGFFLDYEDDEDETPGKPSKRRKPWRYRWPDDVRDDVLGRLLELNAQRADEERLAGEAAKAAAGGSPKPKGRTKKAADTPLLTTGPSDSE